MRLNLCKVDCKEVLQGLAKSCCSNSEFFISIEPTDLFSAFETSENVRRHWSGPVGYC